MRPKKHEKREREVIALRYRNYLRNKPRLICAEHRISDNTLLRYAREFQR